MGDLNLRLADRVHTFEEDGRVRTHDYAVLGHRSSFSNPHCEEIQPEEEGGRERGR